MDSVSTLQEDEQLRQQRIKQELLQKSGYDFYQHSLQLDPSMRENEVDAEIRRLRQENIELLPGEEQALRDYAPAPPMFDVLRQEDVKKLGYFKRKSYNSKVKKYKASRAEWEKDDRRGGYYSSIIHDARERTELRRQREEEYREDQANREKKANETVGSDGKPLFPPIAANCKAMNKAFSRFSLVSKGGRMVPTPDYVKEGRLAQEEIYSSMRDFKDKTQCSRAMNSYLSQAYKVMNDHMRTGEPITMHEPEVNKRHEEDCVTLKKILDSTSISRDLVVRRAVIGCDTLKFMMPGDHSAPMTADRIKKSLKDQMAQGEVYLTDKGFVSTHMIRDPERHYSAGPDDSGPGIEFMILVKKGTHALDFSLNEFGLIGQNMAERELTLGAGTKFRVVKAFFNDGHDVISEEDGEEPGKIIHGTPNSWKIYLETIPPSEDGVPRDAA